MLHPPHPASAGCHLAARPPLPDGLPRYPLIGAAFHAAGAALLRQFFALLRRRFDLPEAAPGARNTPELPWHVVQLPRAAARSAAWDARHRGVVVVRDPRDCILAAVEEHLSGEQPWLHRPRAALGGRSYQATLRDLADDEARCRFELARAGGRAVEAMLRWAEPPEGFTLTRLETLRSPLAASELARILVFLGFAGGALRVALDVAQTLAPVPDEAGHGTLGAEVLDIRTRQQPEAWRLAFSPVLLAEFEARFAGAPERLGYPPTRPG